jgi:hypothetical protein
VIGDTSAADSVEVSIARSFASIRHGAEPVPTAFRFEDPGTASQLSRGEDVRRQLQVTPVPAIRALRPNAGLPAAIRRRPPIAGFRAVRFRNRCQENA